MSVVTPYITVSDCSAAIDFYKAAFGFEERYRLDTPSNGKIGHAELALGDCVLMLADEFPDFGALAPNSVGGTTVKIVITVEDADDVFAKALALGAAELRPVKDQFHGYRSGLLQDPWGHQWFVQTNKENLSTVEITRRWQEHA